MDNMEVLIKNVSEMLRIRKYTDIYTHKKEALFKFPLGLCVAAFVVVILCPHNIECHSLCARGHLAHQCDQTYSNGKK